MPCAKPPPPPPKAEATSPLRAPTPLFSSLPFPSLPFPSPALLLWPGFVASYFDGCLALGRLSLLVVVHSDGFPLFCFRSLMSIFRDPWPLPWTTLGFVCLLRSSCRSLLLLRCRWLGPWTLSHLPRCLGAFGLRANSPFLASQAAATTLMSTVATSAVPWTSSMYPCCFVA